MHAVLLHTHNLLRWLVVVAAVRAAFLASRGLSGDRPYLPVRRATVLLMASLHLQLLLGLVLFLISPLIRESMRDVGATMADAPTRFFVAEHPMLMIVAVIVATIGSIVAKNAPNDAARHRKALVFVLVTLALLAAGIPWQRPLLPGMG